jgi:hypothetical protein
MMQAAPSSRASAIVAASVATLGRDATGQWSTARRIHF